MRCGADAYAKLSALRATASGVGGGTPFRLVWDKGDIDAELINDMPAASVIAVKSSCGSKKPQTC